MTEREVEEKIVARLTDGQGPSLGEDDYCMYRLGGDPNACGCAVGCLIDDEHYNPAMERSSVRGLKVSRGEWTLNLDLNMSKTGYTRASILAGALNRSGVPGTPNCHRILTEWQERHDDEDNWDGNTYIGPLGSVMP